jgi:hypothetical protein
MILLPTVVEISLFVRLSRRRQAVFLAQPPAEVDQPAPLAAKGQRRRLVGLELALASGASHWRPTTR